MNKTPAHLNFSMLRRNNNMMTKRIVLQYRIIPSRSSPTHSNELQLNSIHSTQPSILTRRRAGHQQSHPPARAQLAHDPSLDLDCSCSFERCFLTKWSMVKLKQHRLILILILVYTRVRYCFGKATFLGMIRSKGLESIILKDYSRD
jgi:hypothetical protein